MAVPSAKSSRAALSSRSIRAVAARSSAIRLGSASNRLRRSAAMPAQTARTSPAASNSPFALAFCNSTLTALASVRASFAAAKSGSILRAAAAVSRRWVT